MHPNAHSYGDNEDSIRTNFENNHKISTKNRLNDSKEKITPKENKSIQTTVRLVNNRRFNTFHNINTNSYKFFDEESSDSRKAIKSDENSRDSYERQTPSHRHKDQENRLRPLDYRINEKIYSEPIPEEQVINIIEDEWTFKDLDLWVVR